MPLIATKSSGSVSTPCPSGMHVARCVRVIDLGTQKEDGMYGVKVSQKIMFCWETPGETHVFKEENGPEPFMLSAEYMLSLGEKANLRKMLESWRGRSFTPAELEGFDVGKLLGVPCMINVAHKASAKNGNIYANIASVNPLPKGLPCPAAIAPPLLYNIDDGKNGIYQKLPEWIRKKIDACENWKPGYGAVTSDEQAVHQAADNAAAESTEVAADDIPF